MTVCSQQHSHKTTLFVFCWNAQTNLKRKLAVWAAVAESFVCLLQLLFCTAKKSAIQVCSSQQLQKPKCTHKLGNQVFSFIFCLSLTKTTTSFTKAGFCKMKNCCDRVNIQVHISWVLGALDKERNKSINNLNKKNFPHTHKKLQWTSKQLNYLVKKM